MIYSNKSVIYRITIQQRDQYKLHVAKLKETGSLGRKRLRCSGFGPSWQDNL